MLEHYGLVPALVCAVIAILHGLFTAGWINRQPAGNERMQQIAGAIQKAPRLPQPPVHDDRHAGVVLF